MASPASAAPADRPALDEPAQELPAAPVLWRRPVLRVALFAWAVVGVAGAAWVLWQVVTALSIVVIPLILALFPAAVLAPVVAWLRKRRVPNAPAALLAMLLGLLLIGGVIAVIAPSVSAQVEDFGKSVQQGIDSIESFLQSGPFGLPPVQMSDVIDRAQKGLTKAVQGGGVGQGVLGALTAVTETVAGFLFGLVALFFYLKDGPRIARWMRNLFPQSWREDAEEVGVRAWQTLGAYIRGQLLIALVDAILIGIAIVVLGVPLAMPLIVLVFIGGLFPLVGAIVAGLVAVLVALATQGPVDALILLVVILVVQEIEGDVLAPLILGRATELHPLATLTALTAGAVLLGGLGAFLAIPVTASVTRGVKYLRERHSSHAAAVGDPAPA